MKTLLQCKAEIIKEKHPNLDLAEFTSYFQGTDYYDQLMDEAAELFASQFREPSSPTVKESETGEQEEIMKALEEARCLDPKSPNWSYHAASRIALEAIKKTRKPLDR